MRDHAGKTGQRLRLRRRTASTNGVHEWTSVDHVSMFSESLEQLTAAVNG
jgi:hypothetical protein